jgi:AAA family ATP:ADP antiporter
MRRFLLGVQVRGFRWMGFSAREARLLTWGGGCLAVAGWADVSLQNAAETLFLKRVGVVYLPWALLASAILLAASTFAVARLIAPRNRLRLLPWSFVALAGGLVSLWLLLHLDVRWVIGLLILFSKQFKTVALLIFWTTIGDLVDGRQAKRLYAPLTAGLTVGAIAGSFTSEFVGRALGIEGLVYVSAAVLACGALFALPLRRASLLGFQRGLPASASLPERAPVSPIPLWRESRLFRILLLATICYGILGPILFFQFSSAADLATQGAGGEQSLLQLYARVRGGMSIGILVLQLTVTRRLYGRIGLPVALLATPLLYIAGFIGLAFNPRSLGISIGAVAGTRLQGEAVYEPAVRVLCNLFPERMRARVTALFEGPISRSGAVIGNVFVLMALAVHPESSGVNVALVVGAAWLFLSFTLWRDYPGLLIEALTRSDSLGGMQSLNALLNPSTVGVLSKYLSDADEEKCRAALDLLCKAPPTTAIEALAVAAGSAPDHTRRLLLKALVRACDDPARPAKPCPRASAALGAILDRSDELSADERVLATQAYGMLLGGRVGPTERSRLGKLREDASEAVSVAAETALNINALVASKGELDRRLADALRSGDETRSRCAATELRRLLLRLPIDACWNERIRMLADALENPVTRPIAAEAIADVALKHSTAVERVQDAVLACAADGNPRTRAAVLRVVGRTQLFAHVSLLVRGLNSEDADEAAAARDGLLALGDRVADDLMARFRSAPPPLRRSILGVLNQMGLDAHDANALIDEEVREIHRAMIGLSALGPAKDTSPLLVQRLEERITEALHTLVIILTARFNGGAVGEIDNVIRQNRGERQRAILLEAVERSMSTREAARLLPLLESGGRADAEHLAKGLGHALPTPGEAARALAQDSDWLTRSLAGLAVSRLDPPGAMLDDAGVADLVELALQVKSIPIFERLSVEQLLALAKLLREEAHPAGTPILREGQCGSGMYVILEGQVEVLHGETQVARLGAPDFFGEMSVLDGEARSATVRALTHVRLLRLERADLLALMEENAAIGIAVAQSLAHRLRLRLEKETPGDSGATR